MRRTGSGGHLRTIAPNPAVRVPERGRPAVDVPAVRTAFASAHPARVGDRGEAKRRDTQLVGTAGALPTPSRVANPWPAPTW